MNTEAVGLQKELNEIMGKHLNQQPQEEPKAQEPQAQTQVEQPREQPKEESKPVEQTAEQEDLIEFVDEDETPKADNNQFYEIISSILPEAKSPDDVKSYIKQIDEERLKYKVEAEDKWANDRVKQLNDYVKSGGDIDNYLSRKETIRQYDSQIEAVKTIDPIDAVKVSLKAQGLGEDLIEAYIDNTPEVNLKIEGTKIINQEVQNLLQTKAQLEQQEAVELQELTAKRERFQNEINTQADKLTQVLGVKVNEKDRQALKETLRDAHQVLRKYFPVDEKGNFKADTFLENVAMLELGRKYASQLKKMAQGNGERKVFDKLQNIPNQQAQQRGAHEVDRGKESNQQVDGFAIYEAMRKAASSLD